MLPGISFAWLGDMIFQPIYLTQVELSAPKAEEKVVGNSTDRAFCWRSSNIFESWQLWGQHLRNLQLSCPRQWLKPLHSQILPILGGNPQLSVGQKRQDEVDEGPPPVIADDAADVLSPNLPYSSAADSLKSGEASRSRALAALGFWWCFSVSVIGVSFKAI